MVVEKLIEKSGKYEFPRFSYEGQRQYRYATDYPRVFNSRYEYWYDGRLFLIGGFYANDFVMIEVETAAQAVTQQDFQGKPNVKMILDKFKEKLAKSGKTIHEVVIDFKSNNLDLELWLIKLLTIWFGQFLLPLFSGYCG